jgi:hypothetical protein
MQYYIGRIGEVAKCTLYIYLTWPWPLRGKPSEVDSGFYSDFLLNITYGVQDMYFCSLLGP